MKDKRKRFWWETSQVNGETSSRKWFSHPQLVKYSRTDLCSFGLLCKPISGYQLDQKRHATKNGNKNLPLTWKAGERQALLRHSSAAAFFRPSVTEFVVMRGSTEQHYGSPMMKQNRVVIRRFTNRSLTNIRPQSVQGSRGNAKLRTLFDVTKNTQPEKG